MQRFHADRRDTHVDDTAAAAFDRDGFAIVEGMLSENEVREVKRTVMALADHETKSGNAHHYGENAQRVWNLLGKGRVFHDLVTSPQLLAEKRQIKRLIASYAAYPTRPTPVEAAIKAGDIELELVPQGTLVERVRAGGAGLPAFYTPTGVGTDAATGKEERVFNGRRYLLGPRQATEWRLRCDDARDEIG